MLATRNQLEMEDSWKAEPEGEAEKRRFPHALAAEVAREMLIALAPACECDRIRVCGSLRRRRPTVGDVEIVFVPQFREVSPESVDLLGKVERPALRVAQTGAILDELVAKGVLNPRRKITGCLTGWGPWNRFATHVASGVPVDFFGCLEESWWNTVVCRTGGARTNTAIATNALRMGWKWEPSPEACGFRKWNGTTWERHVVSREEDVFEFVGMPFLDPRGRL